MMKNMVFLIMGLAVAGIFNANAQDVSGQKNVRQAVLDYVEGVYNMQPDRIKKSVHPNLAKRGFYQKDGTYKEAKMTFEQLVELSKTYNKKGMIPDDAPKSIEIYDVLDQTASAKLTAFWGIDYLQLAKFDGKWMIVNVLWQSHTAGKPAASGESGSDAKPGGKWMGGALGGPTIDPGISEIHLERTACYGTCPVYSVVLKNDGSVVYEGKSHVKMTGTHSGTVNLWGFNKLTELIVKSKFMDFEDRYSIDVTDMPTVYTTVVMKDGSKKRIMNYASAGPVELWAIEQMIDKMVSDVKWDSNSDAESK